MEWTLWTASHFAPFVFFLNISISLNYATWYHVSYCCNKKSSIQRFKNCLHSLKKKTHTLIKYSNYALYVYLWQCNCCYACLHFVQFLIQQMRYLQTPRLQIVTNCYKYLQWSLYEPCLQVSAMSNQSEVNIYLQSWSDINDWSPPGAKPYFSSWLNMLISCPGVCLCVSACWDVCSLQEVEAKDHQLNNEPGGKIKEKTSWSSNCYPQTAKVKTSGSWFCTPCSCC